MKRFVIFGLLILFVGVAGYYFVRDPGTADVALLGWHLQTSALGLLVLILLSYLVLMIVWRLLSALFGLPGYLRRRSARHKQRAADEALLRAWAELERGRFAAAEKLALNNRAHGSLPPLHSVVALDALLGRGETTAALDLLNEVRLQYPRFADFLALHLANRLRVEREYPPALELLHGLSVAHPKDEAILCAFAETLYAAEDWAKLQTLLPALRRLKWPGFTEQDLSRIEFAVFDGLIATATRTGDTERLTQLWADVPKSMKHDSRLISRLARAWAQSGRTADAELVLEKALKQRCTPPLLRQWLDLPPADPARGRNLFAAWAGQHECALGDADKAYAQAKLAWLNDDLATAQNELAAALTHQPDVATLRLAAQIHERQRDSVQALAFYKQATTRLETEVLGEGEGRTPSEARR
ncbi:hypothetical protein A9404_09310 [Halothiobacillus diazotrophicus]|uniref:HemY N-terminal domain-containing protein n=1 Tax=Halothiobacillus diazotrophicus TaxID=1860122 RepID=A0A191ZI37_9GAMM|nr:heme biosynthesis HemY N-terminal domain-containing protein [Halothiobacillus diazotrophicus]ANJ67561.1 hypothetical protein A9404_09310 [Halothiobacillus diazotrophicus]